MSTTHRWETHIRGETFDALTQRFDEELVTFFGSDAPYWIDTVHTKRVLIQPGDRRTHRDGGGRIIEEKFEYEATVVVEW